MKAIIPVAGIGTRLRPHTHTQPKALIPIAGKPILAHITENLISSGIVANKELLASKPDLVKRFMRASTRALEEAAKNPEAAVDATLKANPKAGQRDTMLTGLKLTTALYHTDETKGQRPFRVSMKNVEESLDLLTQFGGLDPASRGKATDWVVLDYLP